MSIASKNSAYQVTSQSVLSAFQDKNITIIDDTQGVVTFRQNCDLGGHKKVLSKALVQKFIEKYDTIEIVKNPIIVAKSPLPKDFSSYKLVDISISDAMLNKQNGSFSATFNFGGKDKKIYFAFDLQATIAVFKAKHNLHNGKIIFETDYESEKVSFGNLPYRVILGKMPDRLVAKNHIKQGQVLTTNSFDVKKDLSKNDYVKAFLREGVLTMETRGALLDDANIGDIVRIKTEQGKILNAKILSQYEALVVE
ncbi:MAG: flagellar basal body P-ring formation chaperone FlgA [Sulfurospirillaceae bacterium]|nr:flagellar basal body P-ring formation chaperone FlgA [Sulfurospirillaceae bacterium]